MSDFSDEIARILNLLSPYFRQIRRKWPIPVIMGLVVSALVYYVDYKKPRIYSTYTTFMTTETNNSSGSNYNDLINQFGGASYSSGVNAEKLKELLIYKGIIEFVLFDTTKINGKQDYIINHYIDEYNYHEKWEKNERLRAFYFTNDDVRNLSDLENNLVERIYKIDFGRKLHQYD